MTMIPSFLDPDLDLSGFGDEPHHEAPYTPHTVTVGCPNPDHPLRVDVTITSPDQEVTCRRCGARCWVHVEKLTMPASEVCMFMRIDDRQMYGRLIEGEGPPMVQLYDLDGAVFSAPITRGEAGWRF